MSILTRIISVLQTRHSQDDSHELWIQQQRIHGFECSFFHDYRICTWCVDTNTCASPFFHSSFLSYIQFFFCSHYVLFLVPFLFGTLFFSRRLDLQPFCSMRQEKDKDSSFLTTFPSELLCSTTILLSIAFFSSFPSFPLLLLPPFSFSPYDRHVATWLEPPHVHMFFALKENPRKRGMRKGFLSLCHPAKFRKTQLPQLIVSWPRAHYIVTRISVLLLGVTSSNEKSRVYRETIAKGKSFATRFLILSEMALEPSGNSSTLFVDRSDCIQA